MDYGLETETFKGEARKAPGASSNYQIVASRCSGSAATVAPSVASRVTHGWRESINISLL